MPSSWGRRVTSTSQAGRWPSGAAPRARDTWPPLECSHALDLVFELAGAKVIQYMDVGQGISIDEELKVHLSQQMYHSNVVGVALFPVWPHDLPDAWVLTSAPNKPRVSRLERSMHTCDTSASRTVEPLCAPAARPWHPRSELGRANVNRGGEGGGGERGVGEGQRAEGRTMSNGLAKRIAGVVIGFGIPISVASDIVKRFPPTFISMGTDCGRASGAMTDAVFWCCGVTVITKIAIFEAAVQHHVADSWDSWEPKSAVADNF